MSHEPLIMNSVEDQNRKAKEDGGLEEKGETPSVKQDSGDNTIKQLLEFDVDLKDIPKFKMFLCLSRIILNTLLITFSTLGSQIMTSSGYILINIKKDVRGQEVLGISLIYNLAFFYGFFLSLVDKIGIDLSLSFGEKNYKLTKKILSQGMLTSLLVFSILTLPTFFFSEYILKLLYIEESIARDCRDVLLLMLISNMLEVVGDMLRGFSMSQGIEQIFGYTSLISAALSVGFGYYFVVEQDLGAVGWVYSKTIYESMTLLIAVAAFFRTEKRTRGLVSFKEMSEGFFTFFWISVKFALGSYSEFIGNEVASYFVFLTKDDIQIAAFSIILNISALFYSSGETFAIICRTRMNLLIGKGYERLAKNFYLFYVLTLAFYGAIIGCIIFLCRYQLAIIYADSSQVISARFISLISIYSMCIPNELTITSSFIGVKTIGAIGYLLTLNFLLFICVNFGINYYMTQVLNYQSESILITVQSLFYLLNILCVLKVIR